MYFLFQLERSILATSPRVTRFKIDWDDNATTTENGENVPPQQSTDSESNQMQAQQCSSKDILGSKPPQNFNTDSISNGMAVDIPME